MYGPCCLLTNVIVFVLMLNMLVANKNKTNQGSPPKELHSWETTLG